MLKKAIKVTSTITSLFLGIVGSAFIAGTVAGAAIATDKTNMYFKIGDREVFNDDKTPEEETA